MRNGENGLFKSRPLYITTSLVLLVVLIFSLLLAVTFGSVRIRLSGMCTESSCISWQESAMLPYTEAGKIRMSSGSSAFPACYSR